MAFREGLPCKENTATREVFSGPDGNSMQRVTVLDPTYIGESKQEVKELLTTDVRHMFRDAAVNKFPQSKAFWAGGVGWNVAKETDKSKGWKKYRIWKSEIRQEAERRAESLPRLIN